MKKFAKISAVVLVAVMALTVLVACGYPSDPEKAVAQLKKQGYDAVYVPGLTTDGEILATKEKDGKLTTITITYYKNTDDAKSAYDKAKAALEKSKDNDKDSGVKATVSRSGKQVISKTVVDTNK